MRQVYRWIIYIFFAQEKKADQEKASKSAGLADLEKNAKTL